MKARCVFERRQSASAGLWKLAGVIALGAILVSELPSLVRYLKMERM